MLILHEIEARNFMRIGSSPVRFDLNNGKITLIKGKNGDGKSILCDMICYGLFGKPYRRDLNLDDLVNDRNEKAMQVTVWFSIGDDSYRLIRGRKPNLLVLYKNDEEMKHFSSKKINDEFIQNEIIKIDYDVFIQTNIIGKEKYVSYLDLTAAKRRDFLENIFSMNKFSLLKEQAKVSYSKVDKGLVSERAKYERIKQELRHQKELEAQKLSNLDEQILGLSRDIDGFREKIQTLEDEYRKISDQDNANEETQQLKFKEYNDLKSEIRKIEKNVYSNDRIVELKRTEIQKYQNKSKVCPECGSEVDTSHFEEKIQTIYRDITELDIQTDGYKEQIKELQRRVNELNDIVQMMNQINQTLNNIVFNIESTNEQLKKANRKIEELENRKQIIVDYKDLENALDECSEQIDMLLVQADYLKYMKDEFLSDTGYKRWVMLRYKDKLEIMINEHLSVYGMPMKISFKDNFDVEINYLNGQPYRYPKSSSGQKQRFDLSIWSGFNEMKRLKTVSDTNLLIFDEILDGSLDTDGQEAFVDCIKKMVDKNGKTCFIISHGMDGFDSEIQVSVKNGFSHYEFNV